MRKPWPILRLASAPVQIIDGDRGKNYPKHGEFADSGYCLFLNAGNVTTDGFNFSDCQFISEGKDQKLRKGKLIPRDVVMTTRGTVGNVGLNNGKVPYDNIRINSGMVIFRPDPKYLSSYYFYHYLRSPLFQNQVNALKSGVAQPQLPIRDINHINMALPPLDEQEQISNILSAYDDLIENNRRRIELLEQAARLLYQEWFVHLRFPGHEHVKIVDGVPDNWTQGTVIDFYDTASGGTPSRKNPAFFTGNIPWVKTQELADGFILSSEEQITEDAVRQSAAKIFPIGTVLVAMYGATIGMTGVLAVPATSNQACCAIIPKSSTANTDYAFLFFLHNKQILKGLSQGAAQNNINQETIKNFPMVMPSSVVMNAFLTYSRPMLEQIKTLQSIINQLIKARDLLLPRLMSGEIAV